MLRPLCVLCLLALLLPLPASAQPDPLQPGKDALLQAKWDEALAIFTRVLEQNPQDAQARFYRGYAGEKQTQEAVEKEEPHIGTSEAYQRVNALAKQVVADYTLVLQADPKCVQALVGRATMYRRMLDDCDKALADCEAALALTPNHAEALYQRGNALRMKEDPKLQQRALADLNEYLRQQPKDYRGSRARAALYEQMANWNASLADLNQALRLRPDDGMLMFNRALIQLVAGQREAARAEFEQLVKRPEKWLRSCSYAGLCAYHGERQQLEQASAALDQAIAVDAKMTVYLLPQRANLTYMMTKDAAKTLEICNRYLEQEPDKDAAMYHLRGVCHAQLQRFEEALADYAKGLQLKPDAADIYRARCAVHTRQKRYQDAIADCNAVLNLAPRAGDALAQRAVLRWRLDQVDAAVADYTAALAVGYRDPRVYAQRGELYFRQQQYAQALLDLNEAVRLAPKNDEYYQIRGTIYLQLKDLQQALADFTTSARLNPRNGLAAAIVGAVSDGSAAGHSIEHLEKTVPRESDRNAAWYVQRALLRGAFQQWDRALADCTRALELDPASHSARSIRANCHLHLKKYELAIADAAHNLQSQPSAKDFALRGSAYYCKREYAKALSDFNAALQLEPGVGCLYGYRSLVWQELGEAAKASADRAKSLELTRTITVLENDIGRFWLTQTLDVPPAAPTPPRRKPAPIPEVKTAPVGPSSAIDQPEPLQRGQAALLQAKWAEALASFTQVLERSPQDPIARFYRGYAGRCSRHV